MDLSAVYRSALNLIYRFKHRLCCLLLKKHKTLHSWQQEIARMWRFTRSNGITEARRISTPIPTACTLSLRSTHSGDRSCFQ
jgi:hypothetical protein